MVKKLCDSSDAKFSGLIEEILLLLIKFNRAFLKVI